MSSYGFADDDRASTRPPGSRRCVAPLGDWLGPLAVSALDRAERHLKDHRRDDGVTHCGHLVLGDRASWASWEPGRLLCCDCLADSAWLAASRQAAGVEIKCDACLFVTVGWHPVERDLTVPRPGVPALEVPLSILATYCGLCADADRVMSADAGWLFDIAEPDDFDQRDDQDES